MTSMDRSVLVALFRALHEADSGNAGHFGVDGAAADGITSSMVVAVDAVIWDRAIKPALDVLGVRTVNVKPESAP